MEPASRSRYHGGTVGIQAELIRNLASETVTLPYDVLYGGCIYLVSTTFVSGISWGFMTSLYGVCMHNLICNFRSRKASRKTVFLTGWITILWATWTLSTLGIAYRALYAYSWKLGYPGGPMAYLNDTWRQPIPAMWYTTYFLTTCFGDALMLWRLVIFYNGVRPLIRGLVLPFMFLIYFGAVGTACFALVLVSSRQALNADVVKTAAIACFVLSVTLNLLATALIAIRLLMFRRRLERSLGKEQAQQSPYTSIAAMLMESSALYTTWSLVFIIVYAVSSPGDYIMLITLGNVQVIAPLLIVYRVSRGTAWEETTSTKLTSTQVRPVLCDRPSGAETVVATPKSEQKWSLDLGSEQMMFSNPSQDKQGDQLMTQYYTWLRCRN